MTRPSDVPNGPSNEDPEDDVPLGDALRELAIDVEIDAVEAVRDVRERE